jgi:hypothetical protein
MHAARIVTAHFQSAFQFQNIWDIYSELPTASKRLRPDNGRAQQELRQAVTENIDRLKPQGMSIAIPMCT